MTGATPKTPDRDRSASRREGPQSAQAQSKRAAAGTSGRASSKASTPARPPAGKPAPAKPAATAAGKPAAKPAKPASEATARAPAAKPSAPPIGRHAGKLRTTDSVVRVEQVSKVYQLGNRQVQALKNVSMVVGKGRFLAIAGPSGSGKSTLLNLIGCIDTPSEGSIVIENVDVSHRTPDDLADLRAKTIGFIFQTFNLLPVLSAWENVEFPLLQRKELDGKKRRQAVAYYLNVVGLGKFVNNRPNELSGGQRQRVAIARALAGGPSIVLADEPTANLDSKTGEGILHLMKRINEQEGTTFIFSTHDFRVMEMADRVVNISDGELDI